MAWWRDGVALADPDVVFSCLDEDWSQLWLVFKRRFWAHGHKFETLLHIRHNLLVAWHNVENDSITPADRGGLYQFLPSWWDEYEFPYLLFIQTPLVSSYYSGLFLPGNSDDIHRVITLPISEFAILAGVYLLLYPAEGAAPEYYVGSFRFDHVESGMLFRLSISLVNVLSHFGFYRIAEKMHMDHVLAALLYHSVTEIDWFSSGSSDYFLLYNFATGTMQGYTAEILALVKRRKINDGPVVFFWNLWSMLIGFPAWRIRIFSMLSAITGGTVVLVMVMKPTD